METRSVEGHKILSVVVGSIRTKIHCECGAVWSMGNAAYERGEDRIEDHYKYANRPLIKPD